VRARYAIAVVAVLVWIFISSLVIEDQSSLLQLAGILVGTLIFGAIAWPDDLRKNPPPRGDGPPRA
jgi:UDP-N-acetylmuramyl pentapeptide phosphotransferase/UDP-N-acetylglucosamine-1-phosphate transferase